MTEPTKLKVRGDYSEHIIVKMIDGEPVEYVSVDEMTDEQWQKYCRDTGTEPFQRMSFNVKSE